MESSERLIYFISSFWPRQNVRNFAGGFFLCVLLNIDSNIAKILKFGIQYPIHTWLFFGLNNGLLPTANRYLNQWWPRSMTHICVPGLSELKGYRQNIIKVPLETTVVTDWEPRMRSTNSINCWCVTYKYIHNFSFLNAGIKWVCLTHL